MYTETRAEQLLINKYFVVVGMKLKSRQSWYKFIKLQTLIPPGIGKYIYFKMNEGGRAESCIQIDMLV